MAISHTDNLAPRSPQKLRNRNQQQLQRFLFEDVDANLFALSWLENQGVEPHRPDHFAYWGLFDEDRDLCAVALNIADRLLMLDTRHDEEQARRFARFFRSRKIRFHHVVSRARSVEPFWQTYSQEESNWSVSARLIQHQRLYHLRPYHFDAPKRRLTGLRPARRSELDAIFLASVRMHREETLEDPLERGASAFRRHVRHRIDKKRTYAWFDDKRHLMFKADISTRCSAGAQISGVYTAPQFRNQGIATRAMTDLCAILFDEGLPRLTLYVNETNEPALRVYEHLGFHFLSPYRTVFVAD